MRIYTQHSVHQLEMKEVLGGKHFEDPDKLE